MTNETEVEVTQADCKEIAAAALLAACESDPADPEHPDTICIRTGDLKTIVRSAVENWRGTRIASRATDTALAEELRALDAKATPGPWCWEQCGTMSDDPVIGIAWWDDDETAAAIAGRIDGDHPDNVDRELYREPIALEMPSPSEGGTGSANAALIVALKNNLPRILAVLEGKRT